MLLFKRGEDTLRTKKTSVWDVPAETVDHGEGQKKNRLSPRSALRIANPKTMPFESNTSAEGFLFVYLLDFSFFLMATHAKAAGYRCTFSEAEPQR